MQTFKRILFSLLVLLFPLTSAKLQAAEQDAIIDPIFKVEETFTSDDKYFLKLDNQVYFKVEKVLVRKATGWFDSDEYGNPCIRWMKGDRVAIHRTARYDFPFQITNLETREDAWAISVNFEREKHEEILKTLKQIAKDQNRLLQAKNEIRDDLRSLKTDLRWLKNKLKEPGELVP